MKQEKRKQVIMALITSPTKQKACETLGIDTRTLYNYMQDSEFLKEYHDAVNSLVDGVMCDLRVTITNGITELNNIIINSDDNETKLKAIKIAMDYMQTANAHYSKNYMSKKEIEERERKRREFWGDFESL